MLMTNKLKLQSDYLTVKDDVKSVLRMGSAHNKGGHADIKLSKFRIFRTFLT